MINRPEHDNCAFRAPTPDCNPNNERRQTAKHFQDTHKMKTPLSNRVGSRLVGSTLLTTVTVAIIEVGRTIKNNGNITLAALGLSFIINNNLSATKGKLDIFNKIYTNSSQGLVINHTVKEGVSDDYDSWDHIYDAMFDPSGISSKIVSLVQGEDGEKELNIDRRPEESIAQANLELSLHSQFGNPITISSLNELWCSLPLAGSPYFYDFGNKPIALKQYDPNDPNRFYPLYDIRQIIAHQNGPYNTGIIELRPLNATYGSEVPYAYFKLYFDRFPGGFDLRSRVDLADFAIMAEDYGKTDVNSVADISGPNGMPDNNVNLYDLSLYTRDYLKDSNDPNTWRDFSYEYLPYP